MKSVTNKKKSRRSKYRFAGENGLNINGTVVSSISGPVSFYYLKPNKAIYERGDAKYFPLIVMFGDHHRKMTGICEKCVCPAEDKSCCYSLGDPSFLRLLDTLADNKHPVDFYAETFLGGTGCGFLGGTMETLTTGKMLSCYQRRLRETRFYKDNCPTRNIRWHAGDARLAFNQHNIDTSMSNEGTDMPYLELSKKYKDIDTTISTKYQTRKYIEGILFISYRYLSFINTMVTCVKCKSVNLNLGIFCECGEMYPDISIRMHRVSTIFSVSPWKSVDGFYTFLENNLFTPRRIDFTKFADALFRLMTVKNSLIAKQISKQNYPPFRDPKMWSNMFASSLAFQPGPWDQIFMIKNMSNLTIYKKYQVSYSALHNISLRFLDIYTISRIFKKPYGGIRSSLSFGFFGNNHTTNISTQIRRMGYDIVYSKDADPGALQNYDNDEYAVKNKYRCITIEKHINLTEDLRVHNAAIDSLYKEKKCKEDEELNLKGRCVKKCKHHQERNANGRCVNRKSPSKNKTKSPSKRTKRCPTGQVRDRVTKECRDKNKPKSPSKNSPKRSVRSKRCPTGQVRDRVTKECRDKNKPKSPSKRSVRSKRCPTGQVRDRVTKECRPDKRRKYT
jgi:hypothetical protein